MVRSGLIVGCILCLPCSAADPVGKRFDVSAKPEAPRSVCQALLRQASEIAAKQDKHFAYHFDRVLLQIGELQVRAADIDGALKSIRTRSDTTHRDEGVQMLVKTLVRQGQRERAIAILQSLGDFHTWTSSDWETLVDLPWIEHLIASGELDQAARKIEQLKDATSRPAALRDLAAACARFGDSEKAARHFTLAVTTASQLEDAYDRARSLWEIAEAQLSTGSASSAKVTILQLVNSSNPRFEHAHVAALRQAAVLSAKLGDKPAARQLFQRAIEANESIGRSQKCESLSLIATAQASAGFPDSALKTVELLIRPEISTLSQRTAHNMVLRATAIAQIQEGDFDAALKTTATIEYPDFRDEVLQNFVDRQIRRQQLPSALLAAKKISNASWKAVANLQVATAYARKGERERAADIASKIELKTPENGLQFFKEVFDYRAPRTWGANFDMLGGTMHMMRAATQRSASVAAAAMTLAVALTQEPEQSYAELFNEEVQEEVVRALARAHAGTGDVQAARAWVEKIGSSEKITGKNEEQAQQELTWAVERRVAALMGAAEGVLDRSDAVVDQPPKQTRKEPPPEKKLPIPGELFRVDGQPAFLIPPDKKPAQGPIPWVWYAPTFRSLPGPEERWMFERFTKAGIAIAGIEVGESYGSPDGRKLYSALYRELTEKRGFAPKPMLLGRSRGGLMTLTWAIENPDKVAGFAGIYPVCNIASYPGIEKASPAFHMTAAELTKHLKEHNPIDRLAPLARAHVPLFAIHGDEDKPVPLSANSGEMRKRYEALGGEMKLVVAAKQGHNMWDGFFRCQELVDFVIAHAKPK